MALSPALKNAARLFASGSVKTKREASLLFGLHPNTLSARHSQDVRVRNIISDIDEQLAEANVDMSRLITTLGRRAIRNIAQLAEDGEKEEIRLRANIDLADRSPETSKTQKVQLEADVMLKSSQVEGLLAALAESADARREYAAAAEGDFVTTDDEGMQRRLAQVPPVLLPGDALDDGPSG